MKPFLPLTLTLAGTCLVLSAARSSAQSASPAPSATPSVSAPAAPVSTAAAGGAQADQFRERQRAALAALTPQERQELKTAHDKAMTDPAVKTAEAQRATDPQAFRRAMYEAMLRADPNVAPILAKMRANYPH